jgi:hypothetical protein
MSIKSLFEDIGDAIREKSGSSDTYTPAEMPQAIQDIETGGGLRPLVVQTLPTTDISTSTMYFVPSSDPETRNLYDEYINLDGTVSGYELIGTTGIDLSAYMLKTGDSKDNTVTITSSDDSTVFNSGTLCGTDAWSSVAQMATGETHASLFGKISTMFKNIRTLAKVIGTTDISAIGTGTISNAISSLNSDLSELTIRSIVVQTIVVGSGTQYMDYTSDIQLFAYLFSGAAIVGGLHPVSITGGNITYLQYHDPSSNLKTVRIVPSANTPTSGTTRYTVEDIGGTATGWGVAFVKLEKK